jgi:glyoxylase I family protein
MAIKRIDHISILSKDAEKTLSFYRDVLGFRLEHKREHPELGMNLYLLEARGDRVEVLEPLGPGGEGGLKHVAFLSDDIEADFADLKARGAVLLHPQVQRHGPEAFFFLKGPSGELVEVIEHA